MGAQHSCTIRRPPGLSLNDGEPSLPGMKDFLHAPDAVVQYFFERATVDDVNEVEPQARPSMLSLLREPCMTSIIGQKN